MEQTLVLSSTPHKKPVRKLALSVFPNGHNDVIPSTGIEPPTMRSLARRFNQPSYAAANTKICSGPVFPEHFCLWLICGSACLSGAHMF